MIPNLSQFIWELSEMIIKEIKEVTGGR